MILALLLALSPAPKTQGKLVVLVVIDQLRYQDALWLAPQFGPRGFAGLGEPRPLRYETVVTETAADHATLGTGAYADLNGIIGNRFWNEGPPHDAVEDASCPVWGAPQLGRSAKALKVPTAGDAFKLGTNGAGRVISIAVKDRTALFLAGPSADLALWWESETGEFASTTCYAKEPPAWIPQHPAIAFKDWIWRPLHPEIVSAVAPEEKAPAAVPHFDFGPAFPHTVGQGKLDKRLYLAIRNSPASTVLALQTARAAVKGLKLGSNGQVDYLALGLSAVDGVGHMYGTQARERVDTILRIHEELGSFLQELREQLGPRLSVVLTSDHGLTPVAADQQRLRVVQGGALDIDELIARLERALSDELGPRQGGWVASIDGAALSLKAPYPARAIDVAAEALRREPGIWKAIPTDRLDGADADAKHAVFPGRSGQVLIVVRPLWTLKKASDSADHGSPWNDDALVPLFQQAPGYRFRGEPRFRASQVAPTISLLLGAAPPAAALDTPVLERQ